MEVAVQAVDHRRLGGPLDTVVICIVRGVRLATGALEDALALVQQDVETRLAPTLALFGGATLLTEVRIHRVRKKPDPKKPLDKAWACATEAFFEVASTVSLDWDRFELQTEARRVLGFVHNSPYMEVSLAGLTFLYVLDNLCPAFDNNLPAACVTNWHGAVSTITMVNGDLSINEIICALWEGKVALEALLRVLVKRPLHLSSQGAWLGVTNSTGQLMPERTTSVYLIWKASLTGMQSPGHIPVQALAKICYTDAYGSPRGTHALVLNECGVEELQNMQRVQVNSLFARGHNVIFSRPDFAVKKAGSGATIAGYPVRDFFKQDGSSEAKNDPRSPPPRAPTMSETASVRREAKASPAAMSMANRFAQQGQQTPRTSPAPTLGPRSNGPPRSVAQLINSDGSGGHVSLAERPNAWASPSSLTLRGSAEALVLSERKHTESMLSQALVPILAENQALKQQLDSLREAQQKTARAAAVHAEEARRSVDALRESQEKSIAALKLSQEEQAKITLAQTATMINQAQSTLRGDLQGFLGSRDFMRSLREVMRESNEPVAPGETHQSAK
jgi:hypothetical protein